MGQRIFKVFTNEWSSLLSCSTMTLLDRQLMTPLQRLFGYTMRFLGELSKLERAGAQFLLKYAVASFILTLHGLPATAGNVLSEGEQPTMDNPPTMNFLAPALCRS